MASQGAYLTTSHLLFSNKTAAALYPRSPLKGSNISMPIFSSVPANTKRFPAGLRLVSVNDSTSYSQHTHSLILDHPQIMVFPQQCDINNRFNELKESTRRALLTTSDPIIKLNLIDTIQRLGVGYYFKEEILETLEELRRVLPYDNLYAVALNFRLRRHNGLPTDLAAFRNFMDENGELKKSFSEDTEGLLSLYEASYLGSSGEYVLSIAKEFTTRHLSIPVSELCPELHKKVVDGIKLPRHMRMERLEARRYIEEYGNKDNHNPIVLEFAKLDYNRVQSLIQRELVEVNRWWKHLGLSSKLCFIRDRHVECFLWTVGILPEPSFSDSRIELAKVISIMLVIDDIYDTYGSYDDLVNFTRAIQRWDLKEIEQLPEYMKICYTTLYTTNEEICEKVLREKGLSVKPFLQKTWIDMAEAYMVEVDWVRTGRLPTLKDYIENAVTTSGSYMALVHLFFLVSEGLTTENVQHVLDPYRNFFTLAGTILRLWDDLGTVKEETKRGNVVSSINLLMKEKCITSEEEARQELLQMIYALWDDLNTDLVAPDTMILPMIKVALNMSRTSQVVYQHDDESYLSSVENHVNSLFYKSIHI